MTETTPTGGVLLLAPRINETGLQLLTAARRRGLRAHTCTRWQVPPELRDLSPAYVYGGPLFADAVGAELDLAVLEPPADWLARLPPQLLRRQVECMPLAQARCLTHPAFLKPPLDKLFPAQVYRDGAHLPGPDVLDDDTLVQVSEIVRFSREYRLFVLDGEVRTASRYAVDGDLDVAARDELWPQLTGFAREVLAAADTLPSAAVVDVGPLADGTGWAVVEANPAWASGGYACDPDGVLDVVLRAAGPRARLAAGDRPFLRPLPQVIR
jgi:hypothetical protein